MGHSGRCGLPHSIRPNHKDPSSGPRRDVVTGARTAAHEKGSSGGCFVDSSCAHSPWGYCPLAPPKMARSEWAVARGTVRGAQSSAQAPVPHEVRPPRRCSSSSGLQLSAIRPPNANVNPISPWRGQPVPGGAGERRVRATQPDDQVAPTIGDTGDCRASARERLRAGDAEGPSAAGSRCHYTGVTSVLSSGGRAAG